MVLPAIAVLLLNACGERQSTSSKPPVTPQTSPTEAQPTLPIIRLWLGAEEVQAEQALTANQIQTGLMFRKEMPENNGMLFVFGEPIRASFWMRNTTLPLTCAYIDSKGVVLEIHDMKPLDETPIEAASDKVQFVLEMNRGWFARHNISTGMVARTEKGPLAETYFMRR